MQETSHYLSIPVATLYRWRQQGDGPRSYRVGRHLRYDRDDLLFTNSAGGLLNNSNFRRHVFDPGVRALGLAPFTPHNLRDTAASLAVSAGANVKAVQRMLGHASAAMTLDVYSGLFTDDLDAVAEHMHEAATAARGAAAGGVARLQANP